VAAEGVTAEDVANEDVVKCCLMASMLSDGLELRREALMIISERKKLIANVSNVRLLLRHFRFTGVQCQSEIRDHKRAEQQIVLSRSSQLYLYIPDFITHVYVVVVYAFVVSC